MIKPQDIVVLLKIAAEGHRWNMPYSTLGAETGVGSSEAHRALARAARVGLYLPDRR